MGCSAPGFPVHHQLLELAQTHVHGVSDAIQPSHLLSFPPFSSCLQSFPTLGSFLMIQLFESGGQSMEPSIHTKYVPLVVNYVITVSLVKGFELG